MSTIKYQIHVDDQHARGTVDLPDWCDGDPRAAVALYFFGYATAPGVTAEVVNEPLVNRWGQRVDIDGEVIDGEH